MYSKDSFEWAVQRHDERIAALGLSIWVGSEPTFTDRQAQTPAWLHAALGDDKETRAQALLCELAKLMPGALVLRSVGRLYPGEKLPRWNLGLLRRRDGGPLWQGPPDPMLVKASSPKALTELPAFANALRAAFEQRSWLCECQEAPEIEGKSAWQVLVRVDEDAQQLLTFLIHAPGAVFESAVGQRDCVVIELPTIGSVPQFLDILACIEQVALASGLQALILTGATPPVDASLELTTVTPDPAVIEVNTAPSQNCTEFFWRSQQVYAAATSQGLSPYRMYFNGQVADSGGAGQVTFGGATPEDSLFIQNPQLLPRLVRFLNRHPALSYLFSHDFVGASGQSVRPDERGADAFNDLVLALQLLERQTEVSPEMLWKSLASFLCDAVGNSHRAEVNIEKLWNPFLPDRGRLGLVEFRSLRMQHTPNRATAIACLFRAIIARLASRPYTLPLIDWGRDLHDRFALPFYLRADLDDVLAELKEATLGLDTPIEDVLRQNGFRFLGKIDCPAGTLELWRGLEFWPLVGDAASPEQSGSSRTVDSSTARIEIRLRASSDGLAGQQASEAWRDWQLFAAGVHLPMRHERDAGGEVKVFGVRYTSFVPRWGLHPTLEAQAPLTLTLSRIGEASQYVVQLHEWHPQGLAYPGLPTDLQDAQARRAERITIAVQKQPEYVPTDSPTQQAPNTPLGLTAYSLDMRFHQFPD